MRCLWLVSLLLLGETASAAAPVANQTSAVAVDPAAKAAALRLAGLIYSEESQVAMAERMADNELAPAFRANSDLQALDSTYPGFTEEVLKQLKPALVFNGSHVHSRNAVAAVEAAQWLGIPTATFLFSWDNLTSQGRILPAYDHYLVWNEQIRDQLRRIYPSVRADQITVTGTPQFDFHFQREFYWTREEFCRRVGADPSRWQTGRRSRSKSARSYRL